MGACVSIRRSGSGAVATEDGPARHRGIGWLVQSLQQVLGRSRNHERAGDGSRLRVGDIELSPELLLEILSHVPDLDLIMTCRLVCKHWKKVVDDDETWINRARSRGHRIPDALMRRQSLPLHTYQTIAMINPFGRNFIRNPYGEDQLNGWKNAIFGVMGDFNSTNTYGWTVEDPPQGVCSLDFVPEIRREGYTSCFATSYFRCAKDQRIDLYKEGMTKEMMEVLQPDISVCEWHTAGLEYGTTYWLLVEILDYYRNVVEQFRYVYKKSAGKPLPWTKVVYMFPRHRRTRYIRIYHESVITEYLQSHEVPPGYFEEQRGVKITGTTVSLWLINESAADTERRNSKDLNLYSLYFRSRDTDIRKTVIYIFTVEPAEEDFSENWDFYEWSLVNSEPEDRHKLPEVRYITMISATGEETNWIMKETDSSSSSSEEEEDEQEENVIYDPIIIYDNIE